MFSSLLARVAAPVVNMVSSVFGAQPKVEDVRRKAQVEFAAGALQRRDYGVLKEFICQHPDLLWVSIPQGQSLLHSAARLNDAQGVAMLVTLAQPVEGTEGEDENRKFIDQVDSKGRTALMLACMHGGIDSADMLVSLGADVQVKDHQGVSALHLAASRGATATVKALLSAGAELTASTTADACDGQFKAYQNSTPLHSAAYYYKEDIVREMLLHHVTKTPSAKDPRMIEDAHGHTPLVHAGYIYNTLEQVRAAPSLLRLLDPTLTPLASLMPARPQSSELMGQSDSGSDSEGPDSSGDSEGDVTDPPSDSDDSGTDSDSGTSSEGSGDSALVPVKATRTHRRAARAAIMAPAPAPADQQAAEVVVVVAAEQHVEAPVPDYLLCPLSSQRLVNPVIASDGYTYEEAAIKTYLSQGHTVSPMTGGRLISLEVYPNHTLRGLDPATVQCRGPLPDNFMCRLLQSCAVAHFVDPVVTKDGLTFERQALMRRSQSEGRHEKHPLYPNRTLLSALDLWKTYNQ